MELVKRERPKICNSITEMVTTGCGHLYVTIENDGNGHEPIGIIARLGKAGGCTTCFNESLTRTISLGLKYGIPAEEYVKELIGNTCPNKNLWPKTEETLSCPDGIGRVLKRYLDGHNET